MRKPSTISVIRTVSTLIMANATVISYQHQRYLLLEWGADGYTANMAPLSVDLLAIVCTLAIHANVAHAAKRAALQTLAVAVLVSAAANWVAGGSLVSKIANVFTVLAILLAERVAAKTKTPAPSVDNQAQRSRPQGGGDQEGEQRGEEAA